MKLSKLSLKRKGKYSGRIISYEYAKELIKDGYFAIDPHCHSSYSYDVPDVKETDPQYVIEKQLSLGLQPILTDHDTLNGYKYLRRKGYKVIPAVELTFPLKIARKVVLRKKQKFHMLHINIFGLNNLQLINLKEISSRGDLDELVEYLKDNDLDYMYNHPMYHEKNEKLNWRIIPGLAENYFDVMELNSHFSRGLNEITLRMAEKLGKGIVSSSDSHTGNPGTGIVVAEGKNFKEFWKNVKKGKMFIVRKDLGVLDVLRESSLMINHTFNANKNPHFHRRFTPDTGFAPFDNMAKSVTSGKLRNRLVLRKILQLILQSVKYTAGPFLAWKLHVTRNEEKAEKIRHKIHGLTNKIHAIRAGIAGNIQNKKDNLREQINFRKKKLLKNMKNIRSKKIFSRRKKNIN